METNYRFKLDKSSRQFVCPNCGKKRFVKFIDTLTKEYLPDKFGKCNRRDHCQYFVTPYSDKLFKDQARLIDSSSQQSPNKHPIYYLPDYILTATLKQYDKNSFVANLKRLAPSDEIMRLIAFYRIGTVSKGLRAGAATFPFIDYNGNIRTIQVKQFDTNNHTVTTDFLHSILIRYYTQKSGILPEWLKDYSKNEKFVSCLFGEHLLVTYPNNPVALVEAPKTAIIGTLYYGFPVKRNDLLWLAVYNKSSLTTEKCEILKGRKVVLFPDLNAFTEWSNRANELQARLPGTRFVTSDLLEKYASEAERTKSFDLADYLIKFKYNQFRAEPLEAKAIDTATPEPQIIMQQESNPDSIQNPGNEKSVTVENVKQSYFAELNKSANSPFFEDSESWATEVQTLESFFNSIQLPCSAINLNQCSIILNLPKFISGHLSVLHTYNGNPIFLPYLNRLNQLKEIIQSIVY